MLPKSTLLAGLLAATAMPAAAQDAPDIEMWRLDCGTIELSDTAPFSDTHLYDGEKRTFADSCYLIRNGSLYLLWDAGLPAALKGTSNTTGVFTVSVESTIADQLARLSLDPANINFVGVSHYHFDHVGQLPEFPSATLLIGAEDWAAVQAAGGEGSTVDARPFAAWLPGGVDGVVEPVAGDRDVFGDGSVCMVAMPGHTPGHTALVVKLPQSGTFMLTGDLYHFEEQIANEGVPAFNTDRADTLASMHRFNQMATNLDATVVIQHDPRHTARLPAFPESAR
jgi:glyoxylase-like metal-dependent hydrolase (beta-lactamase superfamily II)